MKTIAVKTKTQLGDSFNTIREEFEKLGEIVLTIDKADKKRTLTQNASLHKYCANISEKMNEAGFTQRQLVGSFKEGFELPVTPVMIKDIFREVGNAMYKKESTTKLTTVEIQKVYQVVDQRFGEITGCRDEWPSIDSQSAQRVENKKP
jgi:hypothetical protein